MFLIRCWDFTVWRLMIPRTACSQCAYGSNTRTYGYSSTAKFITHSPFATFTSSRSNPNATPRLLFTCTHASVRKRRPPCWTACSPSQSLTRNCDNSTWDGMYSEYDRCSLISRKVCTNPCLNFFPLYYVIKQVHLDFVQK